jgi:sugar phosphate isomerase/epimerase
MNSKIELIASYWTLAGAAPPHSDREWSTFEFKERVEAAARAGFKGIGLWHSDIEHVLQTRSLPEMKRILDGSGMKHVEIEVLEDWFVEGERRQRSDIRKRFLFDAAEALGARHIKAVDFFVGAGKYPTSRLIDEFGALCREADARGIRIACEIIPFSAVGTIEIARELVEGARPRNGGVIFDLWHVVKIGIPYDEVMKFPSQYVVAVEVNDGYMKTPPGMEFREEVTNHRKLCGMGEFDIKGFLAKLAHSPYAGPVGLEVLNKELRSWSLERTVTTAYETTVAQFPEHWGQT